LRLFRKGSTLRLYRRYSELGCFYSLSKGDFRLTAYFTQKVASRDAPLKCYAGVHPEGWGLQFCLEEGIRHRKKGKKRSKSRSSQNLDEERGINVVEARVNRGRKTIAKEDHRKKERSSHMTGTCAFPTGEDGERTRKKGNLGLLSTGNGEGKAHWIIKEVKKRGPGNQPVLLTLSS